METSVVDGEGGVTSEHLVEQMKRRGAQVHTSAPRQHARIIERRGIMLRRGATHAAEEQLDREGIAANCGDACACDLREQQPSPIWPVSYTHLTLPTILLV
eukprot:8490460-Pyramimonas_sp.AAC.1